MGHAEHRVVGQLVQADPQPQIVGVERPLLAERIEVGDEDGQVVARRTGDRQVVLAEVAGRQVPDHRAGGHAEHHRAEELHELREPLPGRVGVLAHGRQWSMSEPGAAAAFSALIAPAIRSNSGR